jgi:hypothetical protein
MRSTDDRWIDLADRESDGLAVTLLWSKASGRVKVTVCDAKLGGCFELVVAASEALSAFHHPFAYAKDDGVAGRVSVTTDALQPQN